MRAFFIFLSRSRWLRRVVARLPFARRAASRFVAGDTHVQAVATIRDLNSHGFPGTLNLLGESVTTEAEAAQATASYLEAVDHLAAKNLRSGVAVKLTQLGLDLGTDLCAANLHRILTQASAAGIFAAIDMEESAYTDRTLALYRQFHPDFPDLRVCLQAYLHRSHDDLLALAQSGANLRLVKGAYREPSERAFQRKPDVDANLLKLARTLLEATAGSTATRRPFLSLASHDERIVQLTAAYAQELGLPPNAYEFHMLHGIRRDLQAQMAEQGYTMRVYVPYGTEWYPYLMRRLAERPANVWFVLSNLLRK